MCALLFPLYCILIPFSFLLSQLHLITLLSLKGYLPHRFAFIVSGFESKHAVRILPFPFYDAGKVVVLGKKVNHYFDVMKYMCITNEFQFIEYTTRNFDLL